jgi:hypothetical protein
MIRLFRPGLNSTILWEFPDLFGMFTAKWISLLWRWTRDGFSTDGFHNYCDEHSNAHTIVIDTNGHIFSGFTLSPWASTPQLSKRSLTANDDPENWERNSLMPFSASAGQKSQRMRTWPSSGDALFRRSLAQR